MPMILRLVMLGGATSANNAMHIVSCYLTWNIMELTRLEGN